MKIYRCFYLVLIFCVSFISSFAQRVGNNVKKDIRIPEIVYRIQGFVKWYHHYKQDTTIDKGYIAFIRNPADTTLAIYDPKGLSRYIASLRASGFLSERFLNDLQDKFHQVEKSQLRAQDYLFPALNRVFGLDGDVVFTSDCWYEYITRGVNQMKVDYFQFGWGKVYVFIQVPNSNNETYPFVLSAKIEDDKIIWMIDSIM